MEAYAASQLEQIISKHYAIGELVDYEQLLLGYVNISYIIETVISGNKNKYFLRRYKKGIREEEVQFEHSVIKHLVKKDFNLVARVISTREERPLLSNLRTGVIKTKEKASSTLSSTSFRGRTSIPGLIQPAMMEN